MNYVLGRSLSDDPKDRYLTVSKWSDRVARCINCTALTTEGQSLFLPLSFYPTPLSYSTTTILAPSLYSSTLWSEANHRLPHCGHIQPRSHAPGRGGLWILLQSCDLAAPLMIQLDIDCSRQGAIRCMQTDCIYINMLLAANVERCYLMLIWKTTVNAQSCLRSLLIIIQSSEATGYPQSKKCLMTECSSKCCPSCSMTNRQVVTFGTAMNLSLSMLLQKRYHYVANSLL